MSARSDKAVMMSALALCPTHRSTPERAEWIAKYFREHATPLPAPLPAEQPSNPVALTDSEIIGIAAKSGVFATIPQVLAFGRDVEARIVGQQTKGGGNV